MKHKAVYVGLDLQFCSYVGVHVLEKCLMTSLLRHNFIRNGKKNTGKKNDDNRPKQIQTLLKLGFEDFMKY